MSSQVFVEYTDTQGAAKAKLALNGRKFSGNSVVAVYYPEDKLANADYSGWYPLILISDWMGRHAAVEKSSELGNWVSCCTQAPGVFCAVSHVLIKQQR
jgi:hypothetical protein